MTGDYIMEIFQEEQRAMEEVKEKERGEKEKDHHHT
jgi:hypothetical protein